MNKIMYFAWFVFVLWRKIKTYKQLLLKLLFNLWVIGASYARILKHYVKEYYGSQRPVVNIKSFKSGKFIHILFQRKSQDTFAINACLLSFGMSTRCKFSAYSEVVRGVIQLQVRHLVLQLKTQTLGALCLCDRFTLCWVCTRAVSS